MRWWNVKHPNAFAARVVPAWSPAAGREVLTAEQRYDELVLLGVRRVDGLDVNASAPRRSAVAGLIADGLIDPRPALAQRRVVLTRRGRLLTDTVVRRLLGV